MTNLHEITDEHWDRIKRFSMTTAELKDEISRTEAWTESILRVLGHMSTEVSAVEFTQAHNLLVLLEQEGESIVDVINLAGWKSKLATVTAIQTESYRAFMRLIKIATNALAESYVLTHISDDSQETTSVQATIPSTVTHKDFTLDPKLWNTLKNAVMKIQSETGYTTPGQKLDFGNRQLADYISGRIFGEIGV